VRAVTPASRCLSARTPGCASAEVERVMELAHAKGTDAGSIVSEDGPFYDRDHVAIRRQERM
jgi:hypothetical protein